VTTFFGFLLDEDINASVRLMSDLSDFVEDPVSCLLRLFPFCKAPVVIFVAVALDVQKTTCKGARAGRGKKDEMQTKDVEKSSPVPTSDSTKQGAQTPAKKSSRGGSNSSTESLTKCVQGGKNAKSNVTSGVTSKGSSPASSASPSPSRTRRSVIEDPSTEQTNKGVTSQDTASNAKE
jgi:hypothetical protein